MRTSATLILTLVAVVCGCFSTSLLQEPKPMPPGKLRAALGAEFGEYGGAGSIGLRVGIAPRTEVRAKLVPGPNQGGEVGVNVQAYDGEHVDLMLMPSFFDYEDLDNFFDEEPGVDLIGLALPAVVGASLGPEGRHQLFVAPDLRVGKRNGRAWSAVGLHFGAAISGPRDYGAFIPECAWLVGVAAKETREVFGSARLLEQGGHSVQCGIGVSFGRTHRP